MQKPIALITINILISLTTTQTRANISNQRIGCLYTDKVCNRNEVCFDDDVFGRCVSAETPDEDLIRFSSLSDGDKAVFEIELEKLTGAGFEWTDSYTQCILQSALQSIEFNDIFDERMCDQYLEDVIDDDDEDEDEDGDEETLPDFTAFGDGAVVPKKADFLNDDDEEEDEGYELSDNPYIQVVDEPDGSITIGTNGQALNNNAFVVNEDEDDDDDERDDRLIVPFGGYFDQVGVDDESNDDDELAIFVPDSVWPFVTHDDADAENDVRTSDVRKTKRTEPRSNDEYDDDDDQEYPLYDMSALGQSDYIPAYYDYDDQDYDSRTDDDDDEYMIFPDEAARNGIVRRVGGGGLGSHLFNRNERLDVKKPGPFFKNSANNFFLDKLINGENVARNNNNNNNNSETDDENNSNKDLGQVEYEMPLLAPVKDKRVLGDDFIDLDNVEGPVAVEGVDDEGLRKNNFVHIALKDRFDTWQQGSDLIDFLATEFGLPPDALSDRLVESKHVQFHVDPNPLSVDAHQMAKRIEDDSGLHDRIGNNIGVSVARAAPGNRDAVSSIFGGSGSNLNVILFVVIGASTLAALVVVFAVLLLVKRRNRIVRKQDLLNQGGSENGEEYKQLCRDWSKSSKKVEIANEKGKKGANSAVKQQLQNQDSKDSNRSSTSSWTEEPNSTNMDISTGHMVLAYMEDHLKNKQRLEQEWVSLCGYEAEPCATTSAFKAENKKKNRYPDKLPYDHNRVILNAMVNAASSDYINASSISADDPRTPSYIATQAPLASTVADFWQMIWEQGCVVIVMLTRLQDNGHQLCHRYWPEEGSEQYHIFEVHLVSEHVWCDDYLVRSVYLKNTRTGETRTVTQFHFRSWPAHGVPSSTRALLEFRRKVNKSYRGRSCPIAVHCSDGVGRTGTYILIDMVLNRMARACKEIDIAAALEHIRDQRGGMVQSRAQFEFCLMAVAEEVHAILKALPQ